MGLCARVCTGLLSLALLALLTSHGGALHPVGDSLAVVRPVLIALVLALAGAVFWAGARRMAALGALLALASALPLLAMLLGDPPAPSPGLRVYSKNLWAGTTDTGPLVADILASGADVVLLQEVSDLNRGVLAQLAATHPNQHLCRYSRSTGIAIAARWPLEETRCTPQRAAAAARVQAPEGPFWAVSVHLPWPWPYPQAEHAGMVADLLAGQGGPVVIGGDFNMVPWGHALQRIAGAAGARRLGPIVETFTLSGYPMAIDHVLTNGQGRIEASERLGSDHRGVLAQVAF